MSGTTDVLQPTIEDTSVPADVQKKLRDYWQMFGDNPGAIITQTRWDDGGTTWDLGATIWVS